MQPQRNLIDRADESAQKDESNPLPWRGTKRSWQLAILDQMSLPKDLRAYMRPVKPAEVKALFHAIDSRARESGWYSLPIEDERDAAGKLAKRGLASESQLSVSQCKRALKVAHDRGWLEKKTMPGRRGADRIWWRIVFDALRPTTNLPLWTAIGSPGPEAPPVRTARPADNDHVPDSARPRAQSDLTTCPNNRDHVPDSARPRAHAGTQEPYSTGLTAQEPSRGAAAAARNRHRAENVPIPEALNTPEFLAARDAWFTQRREKRLSLRPEYVARSYARLLALGAADAAACLQLTVEKDWDGFFPERFSPNDKQRARAGNVAIGGGQVHDPHAPKRDPGM